MRPALKHVLLEPFTPLSLGVKLYDAWDAERRDTLSVANGVVSAWRSVKNGYSAAQATEANRPAYSEAGFNGRPVVTFDGSNDELAFTGVGVFPVGSTPGEIWALVDQTALVADTGARWAFSYGGTTTATVRTTGRAVISAANRGEGFGNDSGSSSANTDIDLSGRHVLRSVVGPSSILTHVDGYAGTARNGTPAAGTTRTRIGGSTNGVPLFLWQGGISFLAVTAPLTDFEAGLMTAFLKERGRVV